MVFCTLIIVYAFEASKSHHHTFSDYMNAIIGAGFAGLSIDGVCEPMPPKDREESQPYHYEGFVESPVSMIIKMRQNK